MIALPHALTAAGYALHIGTGTIAPVSGTMAIFARKGGPLHRAAGKIFVLSMFLMAGFAVYLAIAIPGQMVNLFGGAFALYLVATAWLTVWRKENSIGLAEKVAMAAVILLWLPFAVLSLELALGLPPVLKSAVPLRGPVLIAVYVFTFVIAIAGISDVKVLFAGGISGPARIARHLWRISLGLTMAAGSAFTNGLPRLLPGPMRVTPIFFLPQFVPLGLLIFCMIRVLLTDVARSQSGPMATQVLRT